MGEPFAKPHPDQLALGGGESVAATRQLQRDRHILEGGHGGDQVEGLEHDADMIAAEGGERVLA